VREDSGTPLSELTTLRVGGRADRLVVAETESEVIDAVRAADDAGQALLVMGAGSNLLVADQGFHGAVVRVATSGVEGGGERLWVAAGEPWDEFVMTCVNDRLSGLECLSGIPGLTGATPIQNVGAYGQEVAETIVAVRVLDRHTLTSRTLSASECGFAYRDSAFKRGIGPAAGAIVLEVTFALRPGGAPAVRYPELARALAARHGDAPSLAEVRDTVIELRRGKSMVLDPSDENHRSAGSFFTNPIVSAEQAAQVLARALAAGLVRDASEMPRFEAGAGQVKLAAAWLIERAGFRKGTRRGPVGISSRHALALVHHGGGSSRELLAFADEIRGQVRAVFGVELSLEPVLLTP
jgi:UDP-N-acetylmuramate dehydrogenase